MRSAATKDVASDLGLPPVQGRVSTASVQICSNESLIDKMSAHMGVHSIFNWVAVPVGFENITIDCDTVVAKHGLPLKVVVSYILAEIKDEVSFKGLPYALLLIILFALMFVTHEKASAVNSIESAIDFDFEENANFAFSSPDYMGHKNLMDVNSYADFWSWLRLGVAPILFKDVRPISESSPGGFHLGWLSESERRFFLWHNRLIGGLWMQQEVSKTIPCPDKALALLGKCTAEAEFLNLDIHPEEQDVAAVDPVVDPTKTAWIRPLGANDTFASVEQKLLAMESERWLNQETARISLTFVVYNPPKDLLSLTSIQLLFSRSGHIWKSITHRSLLMDPYARAVSYVYDALFYAHISSLFLFELRAVMKGLRDANCAPCTFLKQYLGFWNAVDWISILCAYVLLGMWINLCFRVANIHDELVDVDANDMSCMQLSPGPRCDEALAEFFTEVRNTGHFARLYRILGGLYPLLIMLRLFEAFSAQPRLALVTNTLSHASQDLLHFGIVFFSIFLTYAIMGTVLFGHEVASFVNFEHSCFACFRVLMGDFDVESMVSTGRMITIIYFGSFFVLVLLLMLNMLLAIVMDVYSDMKSRSESSQTLFQQGYETWSRFVARRRGLRVSMNFINSCLLNSFGEEYGESSELIFVDSFVKAVLGMAEEQGRELLIEAAQYWVLQNSPEQKISVVTSMIERALYSISKSSVKMQKVEQDIQCMELRCLSQIKELKADVEPFLKELRASSATEQKNTDRLSSDAVMKKFDELGQRLDQLSELGQKLDQLSNEVADIRHKISPAQSQSGLMVIPNGRLKEMPPCMPGGCQNLKFS